MDNDKKGIASKQQYNLSTTELILLLYFEMRANEVPIINDLPQQIMQYCGIGSPKIFEMKINELVDKGLIICLSPVSNLHKQVSIILTY